jgi:hypothetical protein
VRLFEDRKDFTSKCFSLIHEYVISLYMIQVIMLVCFNLGIWILMSFILLVINEDMHRFLKPLKQCSLVFVSTLSSLTTQTWLLLSKFSFGT